MAKGVLTLELVRGIQALLGEGFEVAVSLADLDRWFAEGALKKSRRKKLEREFCFLFDLPAGNLQIQAIADD